MSVPSRPLATRWLRSWLLATLCLQNFGAAQNGEEPEPQAHVNAGNAAFRDERYAEAESLYLRALAQTVPSALPSDQAETVYFNLAHTRFRMERWESAIEAYRRSGAEDGMPWIAHCHLRLGQLEEAVQAFRALLEIRPTDGRLHLAIANELLALGRTNEALDRLEIAWRLGEHQPQVARLLGDLYLERNMHREAAAYYAKNLLLTENVDADDYFRVGYAYFVGTEYHSATELFRRAVELDSSYANGFLYLGHIARVEGDDESAVALFRTALAIDANLGAAYEAIAGIELDRGNLDAAIAAFSEAIRRGHGSVSLHHNRVLALIRADRNADAITAVKQALRVHPENSHLLGLLAMLR